MNNKILAVMFLGIMFLYFNGKAFAAEHKFVGVNKCKMCHSLEAKGNQYKHWTESWHSKAYEVLASEESKKIAKERGLTVDPQAAPECLKCHVSAYGVNSDLKAESFKDSDGIQCESCHGAGGDYAVLSVMKDKAKAAEAGLIVPTKEVCVKCHNPESPKYVEFNFEEFFKVIAHPQPKN